MRKILISIIFWLMSFVTLADTYVKGYYNKNGKYVNSHYRSSANNTKLDNWSTKGNLNPHTGSYGARNVYDAGFDQKNSGAKKKNNNSYGW